MTYSYFDRWSFRCKFWHGRWRPTWVEWDPRAEGKRKGEKGSLFCRNTQSSLTVLVWPVQRSRLRMLCVSYLTYTLYGVFFLLPSTFFYPPPSSSFSSFSSSHSSLFFASYSFFSVFLFNPLYSFFNLAGVYQPSSPRASNFTSLSLIAHNHVCLLSFRSTIPEEELFRRNFKASKSKPYSPPKTAGQSFPHCSRNLGIEVRFVHFPSVFCLLVLPALPPFALTSDN